MATIRNFREDDIEPIAQLHRRAFPPDSGPAPLSAYHSYFRDTFLSGPHRESAFSSLVCEESDGAVSGFLGVLPVRMTLGGRPLWATVCTQFCVDPKRRGMAGLKLIRHHFAGSQDLSITDGANAITKRVWCWAGGEAVASSSLHFLRPLRPARFALSVVERRPGLARVARWLSSSARLLDRLVAGLPQSHFRQSAPTSSGEPLDAATILAAFPDIARERRLRPLYEPQSLGWTLRRAEASPDGQLERTLVRDPDGKLLGWYIYQRGHQGTAQLLQLAAPAEAAPQVIDHLLYDAWKSGMTVLSGRLDPRLAQAYSDRYCLFSRRGPWMLVHSRDAALVDAFHRGDALFSRLDGEWSARFSPPSAA